MWYRLHYSVIYRDDSLYPEHDFYASTVEEAREIAAEFVRKGNEKEQRDVDEGKESWCETGHYSVISLVPISTETVEVIREAHDVWR